MSNPNNCATCDHINHRDDGQGGLGHCYMYRDAPTKACVHHTYNVSQWKAMRLMFGENIAAQAIQRIERKRG